MKFPNTKVRDKVLKASRGWGVVVYTQRNRNQSSLESYTETLQYLKITVQFWIKFPSLYHINIEIYSNQIYNTPVVKAMVFPVVTYGFETWTKKKAECRRTEAFKL